MADPLTICMTCVGGYFAYDTTHAFRQTPEFDVTLVGVDANADTDGRFLVDIFEPAPLAGDDPEGFAAALLDICKRHRVEALIPLSDTETRVLSPVRGRFEEAGIKLTISPPDTVALVGDKLRLFEYLRERDVDVGEFHAVNDAADAREAARALGYPGKKLVLKPRTGAGSRGVMIVDDDVGTFTRLLPHRFCGTGTLPEIERAMEQEGVDFREFLAMPYYGDKTYDLDCLTLAGEPVCTIPRLRTFRNPFVPFFDGGRVEHVPVIMEYAANLCRVLKIDPVCDFDIATDETGRPRLLDASCRLSGSVGGTVAAGANVPAQLLRILFDRPLAVLEPRYGTHLRPYHTLATVRDER